MEHADQRKEPPRGVEIGFDLAIQRFEQLARGAVVNCPPGHVERLDFLRRGVAQGLVVRIADREVLAHHPAKAGEPEADGSGIGTRAVRQRSDSGFKRAGTKTSSAPMVMPSLRAAARSSRVRAASTVSMPRTVRRSAVTSPAFTPGGRYTVANEPSAPWCTT